MLVTLGGWGWGGGGGSQSQFVYCFESIKLFWPR